MTTEEKGIPKEFHGKFIPDKVDEIRLQRRDVDINFERLPKDVLHIKNIDYDDDDDPDKGGQRILGRKGKGRTMIKTRTLKKKKYKFHFQENPGKTLLTTTMMMIRV